MKNRIFMLVPQVFNIADKLGIYSDDQTNMIEEYYLTSMKMVADMEGASKDSLEAAANQIKEESFDAIGRLAGFNLVYHLTGKNRLSIDQEGAETALPGVGAVAGAAAGVAAGAAAAAAAGAAGVVAATSTASTSGDYDDETIQNYRDLLKSLGWADENLSDETIKEMLSVMEKYNIDTKEKQCAFLAQVSFESGKGSKTLEDGDDAYFEGKAYGKKYRGGGYIHLTWEYGYQAFATYEILQNNPELQGSATYLNPANNGPDAIAKQYNALVEAAAAKGIDISEYTDIYDKGAEYVSENYAWESAAYFWDTGGCNEIIDNGGSIDDVSDVINHYDTGTFDERAEYYNTLMDNYSQYIGE